MGISRRHQVLISHPGRQHSHQAALALVEVGMLAAYWSGVPSVESQARWIPRRLRERNASLPLPPELARAAPWTPALRRLGDRLPRPLALRFDFLVCRLFDRWAAAGLKQAQANGAQSVIACEISALETFRVAKRLGMTTILDAPSIHRLAQDRVQQTLDPPALHRRLARVKDAEVELADHVLSVSELARQSYLAAGVPPTKVHAVTLGADPAIFIDGDDLPRGDGDPFVFLFAGASIRRKGFDLLLDAFARTSVAAPVARLRIAGPAGDAASLLPASSATIDVLGPLDQRELARELRRADCLVLPSRHDSYGMVVVEALASGTPVIVSEMVGAKDLVEENVNGWVLPLDDVEALARRMAWCVANRATVREMRPACRASAREATWESYHRRLTSLLGRLLGEDSSPSVVSPTTRENAVA